MTAQKPQKKIIDRNFGIFVCLLTQTPNNQDSQLSWYAKKFT